VESWSSHSTQTNKDNQKKTPGSFDRKTGAKTQQTGTNIRKRAQIRKSAHVCFISYRLEFVLRNAKRLVPAGNNGFYSFGREVQLLLQTFSIADLDLEFGVTKPDPLTMDQALLVGSGQFSNKTSQDSQAGIFC
jgi:hypothetical protein